MSYLVTGSPCGAGFGGNLREDAMCGVDVVSAVVPATVHVSGDGSECQSVVVVVFAIVASVTELGIAFVVVHLGLVFPCCIPTRVEEVH